MRDLGIMVTDCCNAACRHCLYLSGPNRPRDYMTKETAQVVFSTLDDFNISSVHIGGGEPFLDFEGLCAVLEELWDNDVDVDYIETNGFFCADRRASVQKLKKIKELRGNTVMVSCDPFHCEYVPLQRPIDFSGICREAGIDCFVWKDAYLNALVKSGVARDRPLAPCELETALGPDYRRRAALTYGLAFNGRALGLLAEFTPKKPAQALLGGCDGACFRKMDAGHVDTKGRFVPGHCVGFSLDLVWMLEGAKPGRYSLVDLIRAGGLPALYRLAQEAGFSPRAGGYVSSCALCLDIRRHLLGAYPEIGPRGFYDEAEALLK